MWILKRRKVFPDQEVGRAKWSGGVGPSAVEGKGFWSTARRPVSVVPLSYGRRLDASPQKGDGSSDVRATWDPLVPAKARGRARPRPDWRRGQASWGGRRRGRDIGASDEVGKGHDGDGALPLLELDALRTEGRPPPSRRVAPEEQVHWSCGSRGGSQASPTSPRPLDDLTTGLSA